MTSEATGTTEPAVESLESTELEEFHDFVTKKLMAGQRTLSADACLAEFREFTEQKARFLAELEVAREQARRGEAAPLDLETLKAEVRAELAAEGITD